MHKAWIYGATGLGLALGARAFVRRSRHVDLNGRVVVITGASTGHGLIAARQAAHEGAQVVIAARDEETLEAARRDLTQEIGREVLAIPTDVTDPKQCRRLVDRTLEHHGRVDVLVNNAGIIQFGPLEAMTPEDFEQSMATNFWGAFHCTQAVLPAMRQRGFGRIANVVSIGGLVATPHLAPYTCSKFALSGYTRALRIELAPHGILVSGVYPMTIRTGGHTHAWMKGDVQAEYALFALSDTMPGLSMSGERSASLLWEAVRHGDAEVHLGVSTLLLARLQALFPDVSAEILTLANQLLPRPDSRGTEAVQGRDVPGRLQQWLSGMIPASGRPNGSPVS